MKISKAMKKISRLKGKISVLSTRIEISVSIISTNAFKENFSDLLVSRATAINDLNNLKALVMKTNIKHDKFITVLQLGETKTLLELYKRLTIEDGFIKNGFAETQTEYKSQLSDKERNNIVDELQQRINDITDELDEFNASTDLVM